MSEGFLSVELFKLPNSSLQQESGIQSGKKENEYDGFFPGFFNSSCSSFLLFK